MSRISLRAVVLAAAAIILVWVLFLAARTFLSWEKSSTPTYHNTGSPVPVFQGDCESEPSPIEVELRKPPTERELKEMEKFHHTTEAIDCNNCARDGHCTCDYPCRCPRRE